MNPGGIQRHRVTLAWTALGLSGLLGGCFATSEPGITSRDPAERIKALSAAAASGDRTAIPGLIQRLESLDPGERLLAYRALHRITGKSFGYDHSAPEDERREAVERWADWWRAGGVDSEDAGATPDGIGGREVR
jgi:hypothetical protein